MIIALEGAPAVGKSMTAKYLAEHHGFFRVPEVNELFPDRPRPEPEDWYCERQVERCALALNNQDSVLDGDPFQAAWFSWLYPGRGFADWSTTMDYFSENARSITLPSFYAYLHIDADSRYQRARARAKAQGHSHERFLRKWDRYVDFQEPQQALFKAIATEYPGWVESFETVDLALVIEKLLAARASVAPEPDVFINWLADWLGRNSPDDFRVTSPGGCEQT